jgi:hypothetical protein
MSGYGKNAGQAQFTRRGFFVLPLLRYVRDIHTYHVYSNMSTFAMCYVSEKLEWKMMNIRKVFILLLE